MVKVTDMTMIGSFSLVFSGHAIGHHPHGGLMFAPDTRFLIARENHPGRFFHASALEVREFLESLDELDKVGAWVTTREYVSEPVHEDHPTAPKAPPHVAMLAFIKEDRLTPDERQALAAKIFLKIYDEPPWGQPHQLEVEEFHYWRWHRQTS